MKKIMFNEKYGLTEAVLQVRKTMTRRVISKHFPTDGIELIGITGIGAEFRIGGNYETVFVRLPYNVGEVVAIAQSYKNLGWKGDEIWRDPKYLDGKGFIQHSPGWTNKMFVRAEACTNRIRITDIKVERLQDISEEDCLKEGIIPKKLDYTPAGYPKGLTYYGFDGWGVVSDNAKDAFAVLIDKVSGLGTWIRNPWVFAYSFELVK